MSIPQPTQPEYDPETRQIIERSHEVIAELRFLLAELKALTDGKTRALVLGQEPAAEQPPKRKTE